MERKQPIVNGLDVKGELIWKFVPMAYWQMAMFPLKYMGDFKAFWDKVRLLVLLGIEGDDTISADFKSWVPSQYEKKYRAKRRHHKGD